VSRTDRLWGICAPDPVKERGYSSTRPVGIDHLCPVNHPGINRLQTLRRHCPHANMSTDTIDFTESVWVLDSTAINLST
jgi:hypothetical protein